MKKAFKMTGLKCANCGAKIEREIGKLAGVNDAKVSFMTQRLTIDAEDVKFESVVDQARAIAGKIEAGCSF